jgi:RHS repeat-associated protein
MRRRSRFLTLALSVVALLAGSLSAAAAQDPVNPPADKAGIHVEYFGDQIVIDDEIPGELVGRGPTLVKALVPRPDGSRKVYRVSPDETGRFTLAIDAKDLPEHVLIRLVFWNGELGDRFGNFWAWRKGPGGPCTPEQPSTNWTVTPCVCTECGPANSPEVVTATREPRYGDVNLHDGVVITDFPLLSFATRRMEISLSLHHQSLTVCDGEVGQGWNHTYNLAVVQTGELSGFVLTPNLEAFPFSGRRDPITGIVSWSAPEGFFAQLLRDDHRRRWELTHHTGVRFELAVGVMGEPGPLVGIREPNGNFTRVNRDYSGRVESLVSDLGQIVALAYNEDGLLSSVTDHLNRIWTFGHDQDRKLIAVTAPETEFADIEAGEEVTDTGLPEVLVTRGRTTTYSYGDPDFPHQITGITDERGAVPIEYVYDDLGRVATKKIHGEDVSFLYGPPADVAPAPLPLLDPGNEITRVIDREGNVTDYELHGAAGGPIDELGKFGLRRKVMWTESGKGNDLLRDGEPMAWERRWLQDCDCLAPKAVSQPFRYEGAGVYADDRGNTIVLDDVDAMPVDYPTEFYDYNDRRQVTAYEYRGFDPGSGEVETIHWEKTYDVFERFSRELTYTEPRAFDDSGLYDGLDFTHVYTYDTDRDGGQGRFRGGNRIGHRAPLVTRGVDGPQVIEESWTYNGFGQVTSHTDPNGNVTRYTYFDGPSTGGDINTKGELGGYMASMTRGADGSADAVTELTTSYRVNALGMTTQRTDPKGFVYDVEYNDLEETVRELEAEVTLWNGQKVRYENRYVYDGAGNRVMSRRSNVDIDGTVAANAFIDRSQSFDAVNNMLSSRVEVDGDDANDLVTRYAYDRNDQLAVAQQPEGNRTFHVYDERRLRFKTFYGIARGTSGDLEDAYPGDKRAEDLGDTSFVGFTTTAYDARRNVVRTRDGRGNFVDHFYDFYNRRRATSDQNGNGMVYEYDDASNQVAHEGGAVSKATGEVTELLERSYSRYDEVGRRYQSVLDIDPSSYESADVNPDDGQNSSYRTLFDPGSRVVTRFDANGNRTTTVYDAADRTVSVTDALDNARTHVYDQNSNVVEVQELEVPGPGATGDPELYVTRSVFDELNRRVESHVLGLNGDSIDHETIFAYDSRNNTRLVEDAEGNFTRSTFDDLDRVILTQRFDGDPGAGDPPDGVTQLIHYEYAYDKNSRKAADIARSDVDDPESQQVTFYLYDDLNRLTTTTYPDADDYRQSPAGPGYAIVDLTNPDGADSVYDRVEVGYDENSNVTFTREQRGVEFTNTYDPGNRLTNQSIALPPSVPGTDRQEYEYDALNRLTAARNNYSQVSRGYDPLSRLVFERQEIRLNGSGFENGYERPVDLNFEFDRQSNRNMVRVIDETGSDPVLDLETRHSFDALNRMDGIDAHYFDRPLHDIVDYTFVGSWRVQQKRLGNGAALDVGYDVKRRIGSYVWHDATPERNMLAGFEYDYDNVDNPLYERFLHDQGLYDNYGFNDRYELTGVAYRRPDPADYRVRPVTGGSTFGYDDNFNRRQGSFADPFGNQPPINESYTVNKANEYTEIDRAVGDGLAGSAPPNPLHDAAGNMTRFTTAACSSAEDITVIEASWEALNLLFAATLQDSDLEINYRYDPFRRRIVMFDTHANCETCPIPTGHRYIYDGWSVLAERWFDYLPGEIPVTFDDNTERVYVNGRTVDEPILAAIDEGRDGLLGNGEFNKNYSSGTDFEYYFLPNRLGSVTALLSADDSGSTLEQYRYQVFGHTTLLPPPDNDEAAISLAEGGHKRTLESLGVDNQGKTVQTPILSSQHYCSLYRNPYTFTARRLDARVGLFYYRHRNYLHTQGRFASRDPVINFSFLNRYPYAVNNGTKWLDPSGLQKVVSLTFLEDLESPNLGDTADYGLTIALQADPNLEDCTMENIDCSLGQTSTVSFNATSIRSELKELVKDSVIAPEAAVQKHTVRGKFWIVREEKCGPVDVPNTEAENEKCCPMGCAEAKFLARLYSAEVASVEIGLLGVKVENEQGEIKFDMVTFALRICPDCTWKTRLTYGGGNPEESGRLNKTDEYKSGEVELEVTDDEAYKVTASYN